MKFLPYRGIWAVTFVDHKKSLQHSCNPDDVMIAQESMHERFYFADVHCRGHYGAYAKKEWEHTSYCQIFLSLKDTWNKLEKSLAFQIKICTCQNAMPLFIQKIGVLYQKMRYFT